MTVSTKSPSFPPVDDTIIWFKNIDWKLQRERAHDGLNNVGLVIAVIGEKIHDLGSFIAKL
jgi:hypothetical protein